LLKLCRMLKQIYNLPHTVLVQLEATEALLIRTKATGRYASLFIFFNFFAML
jgi:hypothetical protein